MDSSKNVESKNTRSKDHQQLEKTTKKATTTAETEDSNKTAIEMKEQEQHDLQIDPQSNKDDGNLGQDPQKQDDEDDDDDEENLELLEDPERRLTFFDAAIAIILTLLILPLMDSANEEVVNSGTSEAMSATEWFKENAGRIFTFLISFAVVASEWEDHAKLIRNLKYITRRIRKCLWYWLLTLVFIPVTTILIHIYEIDSTAAPYELFIYMGNIMLLKIINMLIVLLVRREMDLLYKENKKDVTSKLLSSFIVDTILLCVAIPLSMTRMGYFSLLLLILEPYLTLMWISTKCAIPPAPRNNNNSNRNQRRHGCE